MVIEAELAKDAATLLAHFLPRLMDAIGTEAVKTAGKKAGEAAWDRAARVWDMLRPQLEKKPEVANVLQDVAEAGDDQKEVEAILSFNPKKVMKDMPPETLAEIQDIVAEAKSEIRVTIASGDRSVAVGGDVSSSEIITGDQSSAKPPER